MDIFDITTVFFLFSFFNHLFWRKAGHGWPTKKQHVNAIPTSGVSVWQPWWTLVEVAGEIRVNSGGW